MIITENELKKELSLDRFESCYLFYGEERQILISYRNRLEQMLKSKGVECESVDSKQTDFNELCENAAIVPCFLKKELFFATILMFRCFHRILLKAF